MARTKKDSRKIQFKMGWGGLIALIMSTVCVLLWMFVLGFWVGQKLVGRSQNELPKTRIFAKAVPESKGLRAITSGIIESHEAENKEGANVSIPTGLLTEIIGPEGSKVVTTAGAEQGVGTEPDDARVSEKGKKEDPSEQPDNNIKKKTKGNTYYVLQIASCRERERANKEARKWRDKGYRTQVKRTDLGPEKGIWYRVYLGKFHVFQEATACAKKMGKDEGLKSYVVPLHD